MTAVIHVRLSTDALRFHILGGEATGRDHIYNCVTRWPGWKRVASPGKLGERIVSVYSAPISPLTAQTLSIAPFEMSWTDEARNLCVEQLRRLADARTALSTDHCGLVRLLPTERKPMHHQMQAMEAIKRLEGRVLLADDMGLGKTATSLWALHELKAQRALVVCPASVKFNWAKEIKMTVGWRCFVIDGTPKRRATLLVEAYHAIMDGLKLAIVINYDLLATLNEQQFGVLRGCAYHEALILDESHYVKSRNTARTKNAMLLAHNARYRLLLTGTPIRNLADDLYSQVEIIRPGSWVSYWDFAKRHLVINTMELGTKRKFQKIVGTKDLNGLNAVVNTMQIRRLKKDVLHLPPKMHTYPELELIGDHKRVYKAMKDLAVLQLNELEDGMSIFSPQARSGIEAALRCEQIAQGFVGGVPEPLVAQLSKILTKHAETIPGRPREVIFPDSPKLLWLRENIDTLFKTGNRPVIYSRFNAPMFWLFEHYIAKGKSPGLLHGGLTSKAKAELIETFQAGHLDMLLCQVKMAEGWNAHNSQDCIFLGRDWSPAINHQAEDRLHRIGQKGTVNVQIPIVRGTIEVAIHKRLMAKDADAEQALRTVTIKELKEAL